MARRLFAEQRSNGSIGVGIFATFISLIFMGPSFGIGWLISGFFGGLVAKGKLPGFAAGLIGGLILTIALIEISYYVNPSTITTITSYTGNFYLTNVIVKVYTETRAAITGSNPVKALIGLIVEGVVVPGLGGLIGGATLNRTSELD
ncbi:hypothetical protein ACNF42_00940 [Cuniculiplasma sp. SKW3]|uniref:hypothetical protein n=1 Tax=unclassified Cuniculiplasma TaxID=2619706 RepID=UPI003FD261DD